MYSTAEEEFEKESPLSPAVRKPAAQRRWRHLLDTERAALELMGWDARAWDSGDVRVGLFGSVAWKDLSREQQVIAGLLGFTSQAWGPAAAGGRTAPPNQRTWPAWTAAATLEALCSAHTIAVEPAPVPIFFPAPVPGLVEGAAAGAPPPKRPRPLGGDDRYEGGPAHAALQYPSGAPTYLAAISRAPSHTDPASSAACHPSMPSSSYEAAAAAAAVMQIPPPMRAMPCLQTSLTSPLGPYLPKMIPLGVEQPDVSVEVKHEAPPSTICHGSLLFLGGDNVIGHHKVLAAGQRVCPTCQAARLSVPLDRARILLNADESLWSKAREFYVAWSVAADCTISARRWRLASSGETTQDLIVFSSAQGAAKADAALAAGGSAQKLIEVEGEATFSMCSRVKTFCPARNFGRGMGRGCIMHYQRRRAPAADPAAAGLLLLEVGASKHLTAMDLGHATEATTSDGHATDGQMTEGHATA